MGNEVESWEEAARELKKLGRAIGEVSEVLPIPLAGVDIEELRELCAEGRKGKFPRKVRRGKRGGKNTRTQAAPAEGEGSDGGVA